MPHFLYSRQFMLLACFGALIGIGSRLHLIGAPSLSAALYGALHATALANSLRARRLTPWRRFQFIGLAAALSAAALQVGLGGKQLFRTFPETAQLYSSLGLCAAAGALAYGILIRLFGMYRPAFGVLAVISLCCLSASLIALFALMHWNFPGPWCLAVAWWYAFSGAVCYFDHRHARARGDVAQRR